MFKQKIHQVINIIQWLLGTVLVLVISLLIFTALNPSKSFQILKVMSGSMMPSIRIGSIVVVQKVNPKNLKQGDIVTFTSTNDPTMSITHRLMAIEERSGATVYRTKGDANNTIDATGVTPSEIKGKVIFSLPYLGYLSVWAKKPLGFALLVIFPAILIIISELLNIKKIIEQEAEKKYKSSLGPLLILFFIGISLLKITPTNAYFSSTAFVRGLSFSAGNFSSDEDEHDEDDDNCDDHQDYKDHKKDHPNETCKDHKKDKHEHRDEHKHPKIRTKFGDNRHHYSFYLSDIEDYYHCSYEASYETDNATKGFYGEVNLNRQHEFSREDILLGTKSSEMGESYDKGIKKMRISITLTRPDGTTEKIDYEDD